MTHFKLFTSFVLSIILSATAFTQSLDNFDDVLKEKKAGKVVTKKWKKDISERTFLGLIKDDQGKLKYYVVKEFLRVKAAIVYHGHSRILFFNAQKKLASEAILSMPAELPFKLMANTLYFKYSEKGLTKIFAQSVAMLPKMICVEPTSCYDISSP